MAGFGSGTHAQYAQIRNSIKSDGQVVEAVGIVLDTGFATAQFTDLYTLTIL